MTASTTTSNKDIMPEPSQGNNEEISNQELYALLLQQRAQIKALTDEHQKTKDELEKFEKAVFSNVVIKDEAAQRLTAELNQLIVQLDSHSKRALLKKLSARVIKDLRKQCEALIPLASGHYKPHGSSTGGLEGAHGTLHIAEHIMHLCAHSGIQSLSLLSSFVSTIPFVAFATTAIELFNDHRLIHGADHHIGQLTSYSASERDMLYQYVITRALLSIVTRIELNEEDAQLAKDTLEQWYLLLLNGSISCLHKLHEEEIDKLAKRWSDILIKKLNGLEEIEFKALQSQQALTYPKKDLQFAHKVQQIFASPPQKKEALNKYLKKYLSLKKLENIEFEEPFHKSIYEKVLKPYQHRAEMYQWVSWVFTWYTYSQLSTLKLYQARFIHALSYINDKLGKENEEIPHRDLQLELINTCLYANLTAMYKEMPWHKECVQFSMKVSLEENLLALLNPLQLDKQNKGRFKVLLPLKSEQLNNQKIMRDNLSSFLRYSPRSTPYSDEPSFMTATKEELSVAWKVLQLFNSDSKDVAIKTTLPDCSDFANEFQKKFYQKILKPYAKRVQSNHVAFFFAAYTPVQRDSLKKYHHLFYTAFSIIKKKLRSFEGQPPSKDFGFQMHLINICLYANLTKMAQEMPWHENGVELTAISALKRFFIGMECPLTDGGDGKSLKIKSPEKIMLSFRRATLFNQEKSAQKQQKDAQNQQKDAQNQQKDAQNQQKDVHNQHNDAANKSTSVGSWNKASKKRMNLSEGSTTSTFFSTERPSANDGTIPQRDASCAHK